MVPKTSLFMLSLANLAKVAIHKEVEKRSNDSDDRDPPEGVRRDGGLDDIRRQLERKFGDQQGA
jgi:hypothetical protein